MAGTGRIGARPPAPLTNPDGTPNMRSSRARALLTPEQVAEINLTRGTTHEVKVMNPCGARTSHGPCTKERGWGTAHAGYGNCRVHGGLTLAGKKNAAREAGRSLIDRVKFGGDLTITNVTAEQALLEEVRRSVAMVRWIEERIGVWAVPTDWRDQDRGGLPALNVPPRAGIPASATEEAAWLLLYRQEREHSARISKMALDAGIAERLVTIAEDQGKVLVSVIQAVLTALKLNPEQAKMVPVVVPQVIREITASRQVPA